MKEWDMVEAGFYLLHLFFSVAIRIESCGRLGSHEVAVFCWGALPALLVNTGKVSRLRRRADVLCCWLSYNIMRPCSGGALLSLVLLFHLGNASPITSAISFFCNHMYLLGAPILTCWELGPWVHQQGGRPYTSGIAPC